MRGFVEGCEAAGLDPGDEASVDLLHEARTGAMDIEARGVSTTPDTAARALLHWAERLNAAAYQRQSKGGTKRLRRFEPDSAARELIDASYAVKGGTLSVSDAMAMIHHGETGEAIRRLGDRKGTTHGR